ncbi:hypothetical protein M426DRAFT_266261 [Hypoxylon sp. CI-4A]|nr:hypothetical protein M426DRAFT_266261 [Hypoxylon sp. CI-4A]
MLLSKPAILLEWVHIFVPEGTRNTFFWICHFQIWSNVLFYFATIVVANLIYVPFKRIWDITMDASHMEAPYAYLGTQKKVSGRLTLGFINSVIVASTARLVGATAYHNNRDQTYVSSELSIFSLVEMTCLFLVLCVPATPKVWKSSKTLMTMSEILRSWAKSVSLSSRDSKSPPCTPDSHGAISQNQDYRKLSDTIPLPLKRLQPVEMTTPRGPPGFSRGILRTNEFTSTTQDDSISVRADQFGKIHPWAQDTSSA